MPRDTTSASSHTPASTFPTSVLSPTNAASALSTTSIATQIPDLSTTSGTDAGSPSGGDDTPTPPLTAVHDLPSQAGSETRSEPKKVSFLLPGFQLINGDDPSSEISGDDADWVSIGSDGLRTAPPQVDRVVSHSVISSHPNSMLTTRPAPGPDPGLRPGFGRAPPSKTTPDSTGGTHANAPDTEDQNQTERIRSLQTELTNLQGCFDAVREEREDLKKELWRSQKMWEDQQSISRMLREDLKTWQTAYRTARGKRVLACNSDEAYRHTAWQMFQAYHRERDHVKRLTDNFNTNLDAEAKVSLPDTPGVFRLLRLEPRTWASRDSVGPLHFTSTNDES